MSRKVIRDFIRHAESLDDSQSEAYFDTIMEVYEDSVHTAAERVATLESDTLWLLEAYRRIVEAKDNSPEDKQKHHIAQSNLWQLLSALIASTADKGIYLSENFIKRYYKVELVGDDFGNYVRDTYSVREWKEPQPEAPQQANNCKGGELTGNGTELQPESKTEPQQPANNIKLPLGMQMQNSDRPERIFTKAVDKGWMEAIDENKGQWIGFVRTKEGRIKCKNRTLAYLCHMVYGDNVPWGDIETYFGIADLSKDWGNVKNYANRQPWQNQIDIFINQ